MKSNLAQYLYDHLKSNKGKVVALSEYREKTASWQQVLEDSLKFGSFLKQQGISGGDKILIKGENSLEWVVVFIGCILQGVAVVPVDSRSGRDFIRRIQEKVKAACIFCKNESDIDIQEIPRYFLKDLFGYISDMEVAEPGPTRPDSMLEIVFTSGTTSRPKGVVINHKNIYANLQSVQPALDKWKWAFRLMLGFKLLSLVPLSHMYGQLIGIFVPLIIGGSVVYINMLNPARIIKVIKQYRVWAIGVLPRMLEILKDYVSSKYGLDDEKFRKKFEQIKQKRWPYRFLSLWMLHVRLGWRFSAIIVGGAYLEPAVDQFWRGLAYALFQGYGLTETAPLVTLSDPSTEAGSIGKALQGQKVKIKDGQIYVKGDNVSPGYYLDSEKTKKAYSGGWFKTGDLAEIDSQGNIIYKGRGDDVIVRPDGTNVYPEDIENEIKKNPYIKDGVVFGLENEDYVQIYAALLPKSAEVDLSLAVESINQKLDTHQKIDNWTVWPEHDFPRTSTLKVKKAEVAKMINKSSESREEGDQLYRLMGSVHSISGEKYKPESRLSEDLGLDSLDTIKLAVEIENEYNIDTDQMPISRDTTVGELKKYISSPQKTSKKLPFYNFPYWFAVTVIRTIFQYIIYPFILILIKLKPYGIKNLKQAKEPVVFAANHTSHLDTLVILYCLPLALRRKVTVLMSIEHHFTHFFYHQGCWVRRFIEATGFYLLVNLAMNTTPLSRTYGFKQSMENIGRLLDRGWSIIIFPEGRVTPDGKIKSFEPGIGMISKDMEATVVPVKIKGLYGLLKNGLLPLGHMPRRPRVSVIFGKPEEYSEGDYQDITENIEDKHRKLKRDD